MKRMLFGVTVVACVLVGSAASARASSGEIELCPASVSALHPLGTSAGSKTASTFAFDFDALSAETIRGTIAVETVGGWFEITFGPVPITARAERYGDAFTAFSGTNYFSDALYARFSMPVEIRRAFVLRATTDDTVFPWPNKGETTCDYMSDGPTHGGDDGWPKRSDLYALAPVSPLVATPSTAFADLPCKVPFVPAKVSNAVNPEYPRVAMEQQESGTVLQMIELDEHGSVIGSWIRTPPSFSFDSPSARAARLSTYSPAISFCRPVRSIAQFRANFRADDR